MYGVDAIGMDPGGYPSDAEKTNVDAGYEGCRPATNPTPTFGDGVVTPHASFLALPYAPREAVDNLAQHRDGASARTAPAGSTTPSPSAPAPQAQRYLSLDQGMVLGALGNVLGGERAARLVRHPRRCEKVLRPLIGQEEFSAAG